MLHIQDRGTPNKLQRDSIHHHIPPPSLYFAVFPPCHICHTHNSALLHRYFCVRWAIMCWFYNRYRPNADEAEGGRCSGTHRRYHSSPQRPQQPLQQVSGLGLCGNLVRALPSPPRLPRVVRFCHWGGSRGGRGEEASKQHLGWSLSKSDHLGGAFQSQIYACLYFFLSAVVLDFYSTLALPPLKKLKNEMIPLFIGLLLLYRYASRSVPRMRCDT